MLTTQRIADTAGINIASLYQYFPNKEAVLADVFEEQIRKYTDFSREKILEIARLSTRDFEGTLAAIVEMEIEQHLMLYRIDPEFYRVYRQNFNMHRRIDELTRSLDNPGWADWFPRFLANHREKLRTQDIESLSRVASHSLTGVLLSTMSDEPGLLEQESYRSEVLTLLLGYLCNYDNA